MEVGSVFIKNRLVQKYHVKATSKLYRYVFKLKYDSYLKMGPSNIQGRIYDAVAAYCTFFFETLPGLIINVVMIIATVVVTATFSPIVAAAMFITLPLNYFGYKLLNKKLAFLSVELSNVCALAWKDENAIISQIDFIKQNSNNSYLLPLIEKHKNSAQDITRRINNYANGVSAALTATNQIVKNLMILILAAIVFENYAMLGNVLFVILVLPYFTSAVSGLTSTNLNISALKAADIFFRTLISEREKDGHIKIEEINEIKFDCKNISADGKNILIKDVKMKFKKGDIVGIMGESGSGKSTLAKSIMRFRNCDGISVNDIPISEIVADNYLSMVSYYSQYTPIITDSVLNNLNFGRIPVDEARYNELKFLDKFHDKNEVVYENGANLSGGDKQRIALARVFTEKAQIIILDEPTNSLDEETECIILKEIFKSHNEKIFFLISHNQKNIEFCTHVVKLRNGTVEITTNPQIGTPTRHL